MLFIQSSVNQLDNEINVVRSESIKEQPSSFESETWRAITSDFRIWQLIYKTKYSNVKWFNRLNLNQFNYKHKESFMVEDGVTIIIPEKNVVTKDIRVILETILAQ